jgi:hypothetical protein
MGKITNQKIAVDLNLLDPDEILIMNGIKLATIFKKELLLIYHKKKFREKEEKNIKQKLLDYQVKYSCEFPGLTIATASFGGSISGLSEHLADEYEVILIVSDSNNFKKLSNTVFRSPVPFVFVNPEAGVSLYRKIILPVDIRKGNIDAVIWSSYFGRFNSAEIDMLAANQKAVYEKKRVAQNILIAKKLMEKFNISHKIIKGYKSSLFIAYEAFELSKSSGYDLYIMTGSSAITPLDRLIGLPEKKIISRARNIPVMLINSKLDNYHLCD